MPVPLARYAINPSRAAAHIECFAYIDRRQADIESPNGIYIEETVAKMPFATVIFIFPSPGKH